MRYLKTFERSLIAIVATVVGLVGLLPAMTSAVPNETIYVGNFVQDYELDYDYDEVLDGVCYSDDEENGAVITDCHMRGDDRLSPLTSIGFPFEFYGDEYEDVGVNSNGVVHFGCSSDEYDNESLPAEFDALCEDEEGSSTTAPSIMAFWDDIITAPKNLIFEPGENPEDEGSWDWEDNYATVLYKTVGDPGSRKMIIQWTNMYLYDQPNIPMGTFQVILYEGSNNVRVQYRNLLGDPDISSGSNATIGIQNNSEEFEEYSHYGANPVSEGMSILYVPNGDGGYEPADDEAEYDAVYLSIPGAPAVPQLTAPANSATNVVLNPMLQWNAAANASNYFITVSTNSNFSDIVYQESDVTNTYLIFPDELDEFTTYYWSVKAYNDVGETFSEVHSFTTGDQIGEHEIPENDIPNNGDANNDGIEDATQHNVSTFVSPANNNYVSVALDDECTLGSTLGKTEADNTVKDPGFNYPAGFVAFDADCGTPGYTTTVKVYHYGVSSSNLVLRKHNPTTNAYFTIDGATVEQTTIGGRTVTIASYSITDGGVLDIDGTVNGEIVDPVGLAVSAVAAPNTGFARY